VKVAYYSPLPPEHSGISDYSALLLPALERLIDVEVAQRRRRRPRRVDVSVYHVGNDPEVHGWIIEALRRERGPVVLHDFVLHHLIAGLTLARGDNDGYLDAMFRDSGVLGRLMAHGVIDGLVPPLWETRAERFPLTGEVLGYATGVIVHSRYVKELCRDKGFSGPIWRVPMPAWPKPSGLPDAGLPAGRGPVVGCFGYLTTTKRIPQLVEAFATLKREFPEALLVLAGRPTPGFALNPLLERYKVRRDEDVVELDYVDEPRLWSLMAASDICVNLRWPTMGETSGTAIRALSLGRSLVVSDIGWYGELPDGAVAKVATGPTEIEELTAVLLRLANDRGLRERLGASGEEFVRKEHRLERVAEAYVTALEESAGLELVRDEVLGEVSRAASDVGLDPSSPELRDVGKALSEVGLGD
jgi:glycosyltransferase involved in cell wall biosynthesis